MRDYCILIKKEDNFNFNLIRNLIKIKIVDDTDEDKVGEP